MKDLSAFITEQLEIWETPGCAVAVVKDGEIIMSEGFGSRDVDANQAVTSKTLFPIGSTTKAFTAASVGTLVDDGLVDWETPVQEYIPDFRMHDPVATQRVTLRDLLSHSTGLPRHEFVWLGQPDRSRGDLVRRMRYLPLSKDIRQEWQYSNLCYMAAGYLVEAVAGMPWEEHTKTRLLKPLGMEHTNFSVQETQSREDFAKPYEKREGKVVGIPYRGIENVGPAGSINSNVDEMSAWLRMNLKSAPGAEQVVAPNTLAYIHSPHMLVPESRQFPEMNEIAYGLGWLVGDYRGHRQVHHNGGIDGFYTECMMVPEDDLGVVVLSNRLTLTGRVIALRLLDELLGLEPLDWSKRLKDVMDAGEKGAAEAQSAAPRVEDAGLLRPLEEYVGEYEHPGYGSFRIEIVNDKLVPRFGSLIIEAAHRHFDVFDLEWKELQNQVTVWPLTFLTGPDGDVVGLTVPFESTVDPIRFHRRPDARSLDPEVLKTLTGVYEMGPVELEVAMKGESTLTVAASGGAPADLVASRGLRFSLKDSPATTVEFVLVGDKVEKVIIQPGGVFTPKK